MTKFLKDSFTTNLLGYQAYILDGYKKSYLIRFYNKLKKPFFLTIKSRTKISKRVQKKFRVSFCSKLIKFKRKFELEQLSNYKCRLACRKDLTQIKKICLENSSNSRFSKDKLLPKKFRKNYRYFWLKNFFKKKRGDYLIVCNYKKKDIRFYSFTEEN